MTSLVAPPSGIPEKIVQNTATQCALHLVSIIERKTASTQCAPILSSTDPSHRIKVLKLNTAVQCNLDQSQAAVVITVPTELVRMQHDTRRDENFLQAVQRLASKKLMVKACTNNINEKCLVVSNPSQLGVANGVDVLPIEVTFTEKGRCSINILFRPLEFIDLDLEEQKDLLDNEILGILNRVIGVGYIYCPGINVALVSGGESEHFEILDRPFKRVQAKLCEVWHEKDSNRSVPSRCPNCKAVSRLLMAKKSEEPKAPQGHSNTGELLKLRKEHAQLKEKVREMEEKLKNPEFLLGEQVDPSRVKLVMQVLESMGKGRAENNPEKVVKMVRQMEERRPPTKRPRRAIKQ